MNFLNAKELQRHAMKARYGWWRFIMPTTKEIREDAFHTVRRIELDEGEFDAYQARLDFVRKYPVDDK